MTEKETGIETLSKLVQSLDKLNIEIDDNMKKIQPASPKEKENDESEKQGNVAQINDQCIFCGVPLEPGSLFMAMTCCGKFSHIRCFAASENRKCPICLEEFDQEQLTLAQKLSVLLSKT